MTFCNTKIANPKMRFLKTNSIEEKVIGGGDEGIQKREGREKL